MNKSQLNELMETVDSLNDLFKKYQEEYVDILKKYNNKEKRRLTKLKEELEKWSK